MTEPLQRQKSSFSGAGSENCVEVTKTTSTVHLHESEDPGSVLTTTPAQLAALRARSRTAGSTT